MTAGNGIKGDYMNLFTTFDLRGSRLADAWLGGLPPALQAGDPVHDPLAPPPAKADDDDPVDDLLDDLPLGQGGHHDDTGDQAGCLLSVLGPC